MLEQVYTWGFRFLVHYKTILKTTVTRSLPTPLRAEAVVFPGCLDRQPRAQLPCSMAPMPQAIRSWKGPRQSGAWVQPFPCCRRPSLSFWKLKPSVYKKVWFSMEHLQADWGTGCFHRWPRPSQPPCEFDFLTCLYSQLFSQYELIFPLLCASAAEVLCFEKGPHES